jgi:outer membrane protein
MMSKLLSRLVPLSVLVGMVLAAGGCDLHDPKTFDAMSMQRIYRERAAEHVTPPLKSIPLNLDREFIVKREGQAAKDVKVTPLPTTAQTVGPAIRMSLRDLIQLAAVNSLQVRVANYQPAIDEARVGEAEARFDPTFFSNLNYATQYLLIPSTSNPQGQNTYFETTTGQIGIKQNLDTGAQVQLQYQLQRVFSFPLATSAFSTNSRRFEGSLQFQVTQPLLQNAGTEVNRARVVVARNTQRVSLLDARLQLEKTLSEIEEFYWQLVDAEMELKVQEDLYNQSVQNAIILQQRAGQDVRLEQLTQNNASLRGREADLVEAQRQVKNFSNEIKRRVNDPNLDTASAPIILPEDSPLETPIMFDLAEQLEAAFSNRAELAQQQVRIDSATVIYKAAQNNVLPQLNLVGSIGTRGAGNVLGDAMTSQFGDWNFREYAVGFQLEVPIGNREARNILRRTQLSRLQAIDQYMDLLEQVSQEVKDAHDRVYFGWEKIRKNRQFLFAAQAALDAIQQAQDVGQEPLTPDFVNRKLNAQEVLAQARRNYARALAEYNVAISTLERAKGTILKYDNVLMRQEPLVAGTVRVSRKQD